MTTFLGYPRPSGRPGTRNLLLVVPTVHCAAVVAERVAAAAPGAVSLPHTAGCGQLGPDLHTTHDTLAAYCRHPNVGAVLVVALGCEQVVARHLAGQAQKAGKPSAVVAIQEAGGTPKAIALGGERAAELARGLEDQEREPFDLAELLLAVKCGGSDATSGLASNPVLGRVADRLADAGGSVVLAETAEILGAEHLLARRAAPAVKEKLYSIVGQVEAQARRLGVDIRGTQPSPGNIRGGLSTIEEKSLGATAKAGRTAPLEAVVGYAEPIAARGLTVMDTPGLDVEAVTGMVAGGAQAVVFTTGMGTPTGNPVAPVLKITANARTAATMADNLDLDVSAVLAGRESQEEAAERLFALLVETCSGRATAAEELGHREFAIYRPNGTI